MPPFMKLAWPIRFVFFFLVTLIGLSLTHLFMHESLRYVWQEALGASVVATILLSLLYRNKNA